MIKLTMIHKFFLSVLYFYRPFICTTRPISFVAEHELKLMNRYKIIYIRKPLLFYAQFSTSVEILLKSAIFVSLW